MWKRECVSAAKKYSSHTEVLWQNYNIWRNDPIRSAGRTVRGQDAGNWKDAEDNTIYKLYSDGKANKIFFRKKESLFLLHSLLCRLFLVAHSNALNAISHLDFKYGKLIWIRLSIFWHRLHVCVSSGWPFLPSIQSNSIEWYFSFRSIDSINSIRLFGIRFVRIFFSSQTPATNSKFEIRQWMRSKFYTFLLFFSF